MDEESFDSENDALPADVLVFKREVETPVGRAVCMEAHITKHDDNSGMTWIKFYERGTPDNFSHCYVDTIDAELILNAIENYVKAGKGPAVAEFLREEGSAIMSPVIFRMKLDTALGEGTLGEDSEPLF